MTDDYRHILDQRYVKASDTYRTYKAWERFGWEMVSRPVALFAATEQRVAESAIRGLLGPWQPAEVSKDISRECADLALDLLAVPAAAAGTAVAEFDKPSLVGPDPIAPALLGAAPGPRVQPVAVDPALAEEQRDFLAERADIPDSQYNNESLEGRVANRFLLPARVLDASQAWASWVVPIEAARTLMTDAVKLGHQPEAVLDAFEPVQVGFGEAMVSLVASDYRASDFGEMTEIGLTLSVTPRGLRFPDPGQMFIRLIITDPFSLAAARRIWGIRKDFYDSSGRVTVFSPMDVAYGPDRVQFAVKDVRPPPIPQPPTLALDFPRFGNRRSEAIPGVIYSMVEPHDLPPAPTAPVQSILRRSGAREGMQFGGSVAVRLPKDRAEGVKAGCLCANAMACLCDTLRSLGCDRRRPAANGWTEHMSCELEAPTPLASQDSGKSSS